MVWLTQGAARGKLLERAAAWVTIGSALLRPGITGGVVADVAYFALIPIRTRLRHRIAAARRTIKSRIQRVAPNPERAFIVFPLRASKQQAIPLPTRHKSVSKPSDSKAPRWPSNWQSHFLL